MSAIDPLWRGSNLAAIVERVQSLLAAKLPEGLRVVLSLGPGESARAGAPPAIHFVAGDGLPVEYTPPGGEGHASGEVIEWAFTTVVVEIRGRSEREAQRLHAALRATVDEEYSPSAARWEPRGRDLGGRQNEEGYTVERRVAFKVPIVREEWRSITIAEWEATGKLTKAGFLGPETILEQGTE